MSVYLAAIITLISRQYSMPVCVLHLAQNDKVTPTPHVP